MDEIKCPKCGSKNWHCWDERQLTWWQSDGSMGDIQIIGCMTCNDCQHAYADVNPSDEALVAAGLWCDEDHQDALYRIGWR